MSYETTLQKLIREGVIVLYRDYHSGTAYDFSGNGNHGTLSAGCRWGGPGGSMSFPNLTDEDTVADDPSLRLTAGGIVAYFENGITSQTSNERIFSHFSGGLGFLFGLNAVAGGRLVLWYDAAANVTIDVSVLGARGVGCSFASGATPVGYINGLTQGNFSGGVTITAAATASEIGNYNNGSLLRSPLSALLLANRVLTATEHAALVADLEALTWPSNYVGYAIRDQLPNLTESGIVAGWQMSPVNEDTVVDLVGGHDGTINGAPGIESGILGDRMRFDGTKDYVDCGNVGTIKTVAFDVNPATTTEDFMDLDGGTHTVEAAAGTITATGWAAPTIYVEGAAGTALIANKTQRIVITTATGIAASAVKLAMETIFLEGTLGNPRFFSDEKSAAWVARDYEDFAKAVQFKTDWAYQESPANEGGVLGQIIGGNASPFRAGDTTGRYTVDYETVNGRLCKVITCQTAGDLRLSADYFFDTTPTEAAFGTAGLFMYKPDAAAIVWKFAGTDTDPTANGYAMTWGADESVVIEELGVGNVVAGGTASADAWHQFDKTRSIVGLFEGFVDRTSFGTGTDLTIATSVGMAWRMEVGCKISLGNIQGDDALYKQLGVTL